MKVAELTIKSFFSKYALILIVILFVTACSDIFKSHYTDTDEARKDGAFTRGWLPMWIPNDAHDIIEIHDLDTNDVSFSFKTRKKFNLYTFCKKTSTFTKPNLKIKNIDNLDLKTGEVFVCDNYYMVEIKDRMFGWKIK